VAEIDHETGVQNICMAPKMVTSSTMKKLEALYILKEGCQEETVSA
jgi:hypothetical protein